MSLILEQNEDWDMSEDRDVSPICPECGSKDIHQFFDSDISTNGESMNECRDCDHIFPIMTVDTSNEDQCITSVPHISYYVDNDQLIIFHKEQNSLIKIDIFKKYSQKEINEVLVKAIGHLDWDKSFEDVFNKLEYRKALMNVSYLLNLE
jgi:hypothetical protein